MRNKIRGLDIYKETYAFMRYCNEQIIGKLPRSCKYTTGTAIKEEVITMMRLIVKANRTRDPKEATEFLEEFETAVITVDVLLDTLTDDGVISNKQRAICDKHLDAIEDNRKGWNGHFESKVKGPNPTR